METLKQWISFDGRISRKTFAVRYIVSFSLDIMFSLLALNQLSPSTLTHANFNSNMLIVVPLLICMIIATIITWSTVNKRFHDIGKSSKWTWGMIFTGAFFSNVPALGPIIAVCFFLYLLCKKGTDGDNEYGPDPLLKFKVQQMPETNTDIEPIIEDNDNTLSCGRNDDVIKTDSNVIPVHEEKTEAETKEEIFVAVDDNNKAPLKRPQEHTILTIDDLPKLKKMLDDGVISQEDFDIAKKKILG